MGIENNECVIATTQRKEVANELALWIAALPDNHRALFTDVDAWCNGVTTFFLAPCGSKKGWDDDCEAQELREKFIAKISTFDNVDGSNPFTWVEVGYGDFGQKVLHGNCKNRYTQEEYCSG